MRGVLLAAICAILSAPLYAASCTPPPGFANFAKSVIAETNALRAKKRRAALQTDARLTEAAQEHACFMARTGQFSHTGEGGSQPHQRIEAEGYVWRFSAENIAQGQQFPDQVVTSWNGSPGHRKNMLHRRAKEVGVGVALLNGRPVWVMVLGAER